METNEKGARKAGRSRYWSVMLVGDHGRVIPFRHFKALIVGVGVVLILSLCALILLGVLYTRQRVQIVHMQAQLAQLHTQSAKIRDEKDLYLTQLIALQKQTGTLPQKPADAPETVAEGGPPAADVKGPPASEKPAPEAAAPRTEEVKKEVAVRKPEPPVQWSADIRRFKVSYDNRQGAVTAEFRIYNTSKPKKRLHGRTVVVFKAIGDSPGQWAIEPPVPLHKEIPVGDQGRPFDIRNYQTERFKTLRRNNSPKYDIAAVYIFTDPGGELIGKKELPFNVDYSPPAPPKPVVAPSKPVAEPPKPAAAPSKMESEKPTAPLQVPQAESTSPGQTTPGESVTPDSAPGKTEQPGTMPPPDSPSVPLNSDTTPGQAQPESRVDADGKGRQETGAPDVQAPAPPAESTPKLPKEDGQYLGSPEGKGRRNDVKDDYKKFSIIDKGFTVDGTVTGKGRLVIKGVVKGMVTGDNVVIAEEGAVYADARANEVTIGGIFDGQVEAQKVLVILSTGKCSGQVTCQDLVVEAGGVLNATVVCKKEK